MTGPRASPCKLVNETQGISQEFYTDVIVVRLCTSSVTYDALKRGESGEADVKVSSHYWALS
jgi:hypothetical protein